MEENNVNPYEKVEGMLQYVCIRDAVKAYQKPGAAPKPDEWKVSIVLTDEDYVDALEEWATKIDCKLSLKKVKSASFEETYKTAPPENAGKNVWVWTLRKSVELGKTGKPVPDKFKPKVYQRKGATLVDITNTALVGNGSTGVVSTDLFVRNNGSVSIYLKNVLVTNLIEWIKTEASDSYVEGSEFEDVVQPQVEVNKNSTKTKVKQEDPEEDLEDSPF